MPNRMDREKNTGIGPSLPWRNRLLRWFFRCVLSCFFRIRVVGRQNVPRTGTLVLCNHLSWIDIIVLFAVLPAEPRLYLIGASSSVCSPFKDWLFRTFGSVILFERGAHWVGKETLLAPLRVLESGASLLMFPEGDVGEVEGEMRPLMPGAGHLLRLVNRPILPVALSGVRELYWRRPVTVVIGHPFEVDVSSLPRRQGIAAATARVREELLRILPRYVDPAPARKHLRFLTDLADHL